MTSLRQRIGRLACLCVALTALGVEGRGPVRCSLINLIATPERFDGVRIQTVGYVRLRFEGNALFLSEDDAKHENTRNGLWLERNRDLEIRDGYALVEGVFRSDAKGHMALWSGTISDIARIEPWPPAQLPDAAATQ